MSTRDTLTAAVEAVTGPLDQLDPGQAADLAAGLRAIADALPGEDPADRRAADALRLAAERATG